MREILFFWVSYQSTYAEDANGGVCWLRGCEGGGLWWDFPLHDTAAFSACINEASLTCLVILCKLQDQGTYRKPSAMQCVSVCVYLYLSQGHIFRNLSFCIQNEINLDIFWWRPGLKEHLLSKFCISECYISIEPHKNRVFLISLSHKVTLNECLLLQDLIFAVLDGSILHTLLIKHVLELLGGTVYILISIMQCTEFLKYAVASIGRKKIWYYRCLFRQSAHWR